MRSSLGRCWLIVALGISTTGCGPSEITTIQGCGATFPAPLYKRWFLEFYRTHPDVRVNYLAIGSGAGVRQLSEGLVDFCGTDEAVSEDKLRSIGKHRSEAEGRDVELVQIPMTAGCIAICYNLPGNPQLKLKRAAYVGICLGQIKFWDDEQIKATNRDAELPHREITFIRRADSSGTTFNFTNHLNAIDERWQKDHGGPGAGKAVNWPAGIGGKGNSGVAALIQQTPGAIGYLEAGYAELTHLPIAELENHAGQFVLPTGEAARAGLMEAKFNKVFGATVPDPKDQSAYPIVTFTWVVFRKEYANPVIGEKLKEVLQSCLDDHKGQGQSLSEGLGYVPMPESTLAEARKQVNAMKLRAAGGHDTGEHRTAGLKGGTGR